MSIVRRLERRGADPTKPWGDSSPPPPGLGGLNAAGVSVSEDSAFQLATVYACVSILADAVSTLPLGPYQQVGSVLEPAKTMPAVLEQPFAELTRQDYIAQGQVSLCLRGNHYAFVTQRDRNGYPSGLFPLHPDQVSVRRDIDGNRVYRVNGTVERSEDIFHVPGLMVPGAVEGLNPIKYARMSFGLGLATDAYAAAFFQNSAMPSGAIEVPGNLNENETLELARNWIAAHQGVGKAHLPAVLTGGAKWSQISIAPDDAQFLQTRDANQHDIAQIFRIPEHMLGMQDRTSSWGTGVEQMSIGFVRYTLRSWTSRWENAFSRIIPRNVVAKFDFKELLRGDTLQRFQAWAIARGNSWMNIDEIRAEEGQAPLPDGLGQDYWAPVNFQPVQAAINPQPSEPTAPPPATP